MSLNGFDVSNVNGPSIIGQALAGDFVILKASEGVTFRDSLHDGFAAQARAAGKLVGHYHFAHPSNDPVAEADWFLSCASPLPGEVLVLDFEPYDQPVADAGFPLWIETFSAAITQATGAPCWLYINDDLGQRLHAVADEAQLEALYGMPLWKASYQPTPGSAMGWDAVTCWQWSGSGIDKDTFYGDALLWRSLGVPEEGAAMARTTWRGVTVDTRTAAMLDEANRLTPTLPLYPAQGSYSTLVRASGGTHSGGGAVDIMLTVSGRVLTDAEAHTIETVLRSIGFAAWYRPTILGVWGRHVHAIATGCGDMSYAASIQVVEYRAGLDGLAGRGGDTGTRAFVNVTWESYQQANPGTPGSSSANSSVNPALTQGATWDPTTTTVETDMTPKIITALGPNNATAADDGLMLVTAEGRFVALGPADVALAQRYVQFCANPKDGALYMSQVAAIQAMLARAH